MLSGHDYTTSGSVTHTDLHEESEVGLWLDAPQVCRLGHVERQPAHISGLQHSAIHLTDSQRVRTHVTTLACGREVMRGQVTCGH